MMNFHCVYMFFQPRQPNECEQIKSFRFISKPCCCGSSNIVTAFLILCVLQPASLNKDDFWGLVCIFHKLAFLVFLQEATDLEVGQPHSQNVLRRTSHLWILRMNKLLFRRSTRSWCLTSSAQSPPTTPPWKTLERQVRVGERCSLGLSFQYIPSTKLHQQR